MMEKMTYRITDKMESATAIKVIALLQKMENPQVPVILDKPHFGFV